MPSTEREGSTDRELVLKHQHSFAESTSSRSSVPMWDSADPDRAPPPLPLNTSSASPTRPNTSAAIASAAAVFTEKARESASSYTVNPLPPKRDGSPDKSLIRGHHHKRMQSLQTASSSSLRDVSLYLDSPGSKSPERSLVLSSTPTSRDRKRDNTERSPDRTPTRAYSPTSFLKDTTKEIPAMRPSTRPPPRSILGENTPPTSATMLAIQNMATPINIDAPLANATNSSTTAVTRTPQTFDAISSQILSLTSIATNLQREMTQLSRRSKDNATDLISLKEATNARDEDIRKSLKELVSNLSKNAAELKKEKDAQGTTRSQSTPTHGSGAFLLDNKPHCDPMTRAFLPRIPSPNSFAASLERELAGSPSPYHMDGAASLALLEKILREMATKEGQQRMFDSLSELASKDGGSGTETTKKLEEILKLLQEKPGPLAMVSQPKGGSSGPYTLEFEAPRSGPLARTARDVTPHSNVAQQQQSPQQPNGRAPYSSPRAADFIGDEILKLLRKMKDSVTENGGMTSEIKSLVRELRGEVLGMGREIGRKLDTEQGAAAKGPNKAELAKIIEDGLSELREHMDRVVKDKRRQSSSSTISRSTVDSQEVYQAVKHALGDIQALRSNPNPGLSKEEILDAIKDAWESYRPEIELQNFGLERDEILQCLREGLDQHQSRGDESVSNRVEILEAIQEGLKDFKAPKPETESSLTRDELLVTVRECLENFEFPSHSASSTRGVESELTYENVIDAAKEALVSFKFPNTSSVDISEEALSLAVKEAIKERGIPADSGVGEQVLDQLSEMLDEMRNQFQGVSDEAKQNVAANGRDTEQVLDAVKDGLERLRADIETYVDHAADVTGRDEIIDSVKLASEQLSEKMEAIKGSGLSGDSSSDIRTIKEELEHLRTILATTLIKNNSSMSGDIIDAIREEFEHMRSKLPQEGAEGSSARSVDVMKEEFEQLRTNISSSLVMPAAQGVQREEIVEAIKEGMEGLRAEMEQMQRTKDRPESILSSTSEILDAFNDGIDVLRADVEKLTKKAEAPSVSDEILETLKEGLASVRADLDSLKQRPTSSHSSRELTPKEGEIVTADSLKRDDIENLEILMTQLRIKVESLDGMPPPNQASANMPDAGVSREHFAAVEQVIREVQASVAELHSRDRDGESSTINRDDMDALETLLINTKAKIDDVLVPAAELSAQKQHVEYLETTLKDVRDAVDDIAAKVPNDSQRKEDVIVLESLIKDLHASVDEMKERAAQEYESGERPSKTDLDAVETICIDTKMHIEQLIIPHLESLPTKTEVGQIQEIVVGHKEHAGRDTVEIIRMLEDRKTDHDALTKEVVTFKTVMDELKEEIKLKIEDGAQGIDDLGRLIDNLGETITSSSGASADIKELIETVQREFERSHGSIDSIKLDADDQTAVIVQKQEERTAELLAKLDDRFDEIMTKFDDAQLDAKEKQDAFEDSKAASDDLLAATRVVLDEVKLNTATLGTTFTDVAERIGEDSKTVFSRVEDTYSKVDMMHGDVQAAHHTTHTGIQKAQTTLDGLHSQVHEFQPKIFNSVKDILLIVGQHFEQSRKHTEELVELRDHHQRHASPAIEPAPVATAGPTVQQILEREKYDDSELHSKLDQVLATLTSAAQMSLLEQINAHVSTTSSEMTQFVTAQAKLITEDHESRERAAEAAALQVEKRLAQRDALDAELAGMTAQKDVLALDLREIRDDLKTLTGQKGKLAAELASLETALKIRKEELGVMEARAEGLERRMLEGVIDHSRALRAVGSRSGGSTLSSNNARSTLSTNTDTMSLKRVASRQSSRGGASSVLSRSTAPGGGLSTALKRAVIAAPLVRKTPKTSVTPLAANSPANNTPTGARRILSLSQITHNVPHGGGSGPHVQIAAPAGTGMGGMKGLSRSQSVRTTHGVVGGRKSSWNPRVGGVAKEGIEGGVEEKENDDDGDQGERGLELARRASTRSRRSVGGTGGRRRSSLGSGSVVHSSLTEEEEESGDEEDVSVLESEVWTESVVGTVGDGE